MDIVAQSPLQLRLDRGFDQCIQRHMWVACFYNVVFIKSQRQENRLDLKCAGHFVIIQNLEKSLPSHSRLFIKPTPCQRVQEGFLGRHLFHAFEPFGFGGEAFGEALIGEVRVCFGGGGL